MASNAVVKNLPEDQAVLCDAFTAGDRPDLNTLV